MSQTLAQIRTAIRQRADMVNSQFVTDAELNSYINQSLCELYDLLITLYEDYYVAAPLTFQTDGTSAQYPLPDGTLYSAAPAFYKILGCDLGLTGNANAWVTLKKFDFISRNRYLYPQVTSTYLGVFNLRYRVVGDTIMFIPTPSAGQYVKLWYIPQLTQLSSDTDKIPQIMSGAGYSEYVIVDGAIKCLQKEESDVSVLQIQKMALIKRIEDSGMNRDAGQPDTISDVRTRAESWGGYGDSGGGGPHGGF
jgi:hypothetical protein